VFWVVRRGQSGWWVVNFSEGPSLEK